MIWDSKVMMAGNNSCCALQLQFTVAGFSRQQSAPLPFVPPAES
jgi:hypothetical protein